MPLLNYTTTIDTHKSVGEIIGILVKHGATKIMHDYTEDGNVEAISFMLKTPHGPRGFKLPANAQKVLAVMQRQKITRVKCDFTQAERVAWRILKDWLEAQLAILESEQVTIDQLFLPHMMDQNGNTVYEVYCENQMYLEDGRHEEN